jgi:hypothetical protein
MFRSDSAPTVLSPNPEYWNQSLEISANEAVTGTVW